MVRHHMKIRKHVIKNVLRLNVSFRFRSAPRCDLSGCFDGHCVVCGDYWIIVASLQEKLYLHPEASDIWQCLLQTDKLPSQWSRWECFTPRPRDTSTGLVCVCVCECIGACVRVWFAWEFSQGDSSGNMIKIVELSVRTVATGGYCAQIGQSCYSPFKINMKGIFFMK